MMTARLRSWWLKIQKHRLVVISSILVLLVALVLAGYIFHWNWTGLNSGYDKVTTESTSHSITTTYEQPVRTLWDWLQLLIIPLVLAIGGFWLNQVQKNREERATTRREQIDRSIAHDNQQATALKDYLDKMSELLLDGHLRTSKPNDDIRYIARARTLTILLALDGLRKRSVIQFLYESNLIKLDEGNNLVDLRVANLRDADLWNIDLHNARLFAVSLRKANLRESDLSNADLSYADLRGTDLSGAELEGANLHEAVYNTKAIQEKSAWGKLITDRQGNPVMVEPTRWPQGFDPKTAGAICKNYLP